jgi:hypothetical protein
VGLVEEALGDEALVEEVLGQQILWKSPWWKRTLCAGLEGDAILVVFERKDANGNAS